MLYYMTYYLYPIPNKNRWPTFYEDQKKTTWRKIRCEVKKKQKQKFKDMALDGEESTPVPNLALEAIVKPAIREVMS